MNTLEYMVFSIGLGACFGGIRIGMFGRHIINIKNKKDGNYFVDERGGEYKIKEPLLIKIGLFRDRAEINTVAHGIIKKHSFKSIDFKFDLD